MKCMSRLNRGYSPCITINITPTTLQVLRKIPFPDASETRTAPLTVGSVYGKNKAFEKTGFRYRVII